MYLEKKNHLLKSSKGYISKSLIVINVDRVV
jgi:hypothetical protein